MPFFPNGCRALLDGWRNTKFVSWHTAQPNSSGSNAVTASGSSRLPIGTLTLGTTGSAGTATNAAAIESAAAACALAAHHAPVDCVGAHRRPVPRVRGNSAPR